MARVTVEDCVEVVPNRFELVLLAAARAREISRGAALSVDRDNDKNSVIALREVAEQSVPLTSLKESIIRAMQRTFVNDENDDDLDQELADDGFGALSFDGADDDDDDDDVISTNLLREDAAHNLAIEDALPEIAEEN